MIQILAVFALFAAASAHPLYDDNYLLAANVVPGAVLPLQRAGIEGVLRVNGLAGGHVDLDVSGGRGRGLSVRASAQDGLTGIGRSAHTVVRGVNQPTLYGGVGGLQVSRRVANQGLLGNRKVTNLNGQLSRSVSASNVYTGGLPVRPVVGVATLGGPVAVPLGPALVGAAARGLAVGAVTGAGVVARGLYD